MRNLFLILLFVNLLLLGWQLWVDPESSADISLAGSSELLIYGQQGSGAPAAPGKVATSAQCVYIGPVPDAAAAQQLQGILAEREISAQPVMREGQVWVGHWVQVQGFADKDLAEAARQRLLAADLPDAYLMQDGATTIISLGVFRERARAERVREAARRAGFATVMKERVRAAAEYWLVSGLASDQQAALKDLGMADDRILRAESAPCPPLSAPLSGAVAPE